MKENPLGTTISAIKDIYNKLPEGVEIVHSCSTGYGEALIKAALLLDEGEVETVSHYYAASFFEPDVDCILDIGGQDMKAIWLDNGVITNIVVNEACSSGCGSFWKILHPPCIFRRGRLLKRHFLRSIRLRSEAAVPSL